LSGEWKPKIRSADNHSPDPVGCRSPRPESAVSRLRFRLRQTSASQVASPRRRKSAVGMITQTHCKENFVLNPVGTRSTRVPFFSKPEEVWDAVERVPTKLFLYALALHPFPNSMLKPSLSKRCRDHRAPPNRSKRLDSGAVSAAFSPSDCGIDLPAKMPSLQSACLSHPHPPRSSPPTRDTEVGILSSRARGCG
jgi:hypothetical protein